MKFIYDEVMEEYQSTEKRMDIIIAADVFSDEVCEYAKNITGKYPEKLQEIGEIVAEQDFMQEEHSEMTVSEIILRLGKPVIMIEGEADGELCGIISYFENKIDENEVIEVEFTGELNFIM